MSGRVVDSDFVKSGELVPLSYISLTEQNNPRENAAAIQAEYLERREMRDLAVERPMMMAPVVESGVPMSERSVAKDMKNLELYNLIEESKGWLPRSEYLEILAEHGLPDLPSSSDAFKRMLMNMPGKEKALREEFERRAVEHGVGRKLREAPAKEAARRLVHTYPAASADALRKQILSVSLFPNLYNKKTLLAGM